MTKISQWTHESYEELIDRLVNSNPDRIEQIKANPKLVGWLVGQGMIESHGTANPHVLYEMFAKKLGITIESTR